MDYKAARKLVPSILLPWLDRMEASPSGWRLARGVFWSAVGSVITRALALVSAIVLARLLGKVTFGELGMIQSTLSMFATFAIFGVGLTATKHVAEYRKSDAGRAGRVIALSSGVAVLSGSAMALVMTLTAPWMAKHWLAAPHLGTAVAVSACALVWGVLNEAQLGTLSGLEAFRRRSTMQSLGNLGAFPITVAGAYFFGLIGDVWGLVASSLLLVILNNYAVRKEAALAGIPLKWKDAPREIGLLWRFNLPTFFSGAFYVPAIWVSNAIMVHTPHGDEAVGVFSAADRWRNAIMFLPTLLGGVTLPMLSSLRAESSSREYHKVLWMNLGISALMSLIAAVPIALLAPWIMASYGPGFAEGKWVLVCLCASAVVHSTYWIIGQSMVSKGRMWTMFRLNLLWGTVLLTVTWTLRERGALGLALANVAADIVRMLLILFGTSLLHRTDSRTSV
jgi:O-antigen/teichoic acid export membrane protein